MVAGMHPFDNLLSTNAYGSDGLARHKSFKMVWMLPTSPRLWDVVVRRCDEPRGGGGCRLRM